MHKLQPEYANYLLEFPWDVYITQTFKHRRNDATNAVIAWWKVMELRLGWTRSFCAVESHRLGGVHLHAIAADDLHDWSDVRLANRLLVKHIGSSKKYLDKAFGWTATSPANNQATVNLYVAKYVTKGDGDYHFLGHW